MKFSLIFDSGDSIEFGVVNNADILEYFVDQCNRNQCNQFSDGREIATTVGKYLTDVHSCLSNTNSVMHDLGLRGFPQKDCVTDYLDQGFLNRQHEQWVDSQRQIINIDQLQQSDQSNINELGWRLHDMYPDHERDIPLAQIMSKLGRIWHYEEVNMTVHRLEHYFSRNIEFKSPKKWQVFDNPFTETMISNNDVVNFSFGYTYVGRQFYNKWKFFDTKLECQDHYNYETLEFAFQLNLGRPETVPYSQEFMTWCRDRNVPAITTQIPIANVVDLESKLTYYRNMLYKNSQQGHSARICLH